MTQAKNPRAGDAVLLCNPRAGGRWRALAEILDSDEAKGVRRIVTDEIDDVAGALASVGRRARLICIYGGDGTIYHVLNQLLASWKAEEGPLPRLAFVGGGTMNVTGQLTGMRGEPGDNFRAVMRAYLADRLMLRELPVLHVRQGDTSYYGFTFGLGPLVRLLNRYEQGQKGKLAAVGLAAQAIAAALSPISLGWSGMLDQLEARVVVDGKPIEASQFAAVFANTTGHIQRLVTPFNHTRSRDTFHFLAYAVSARQIAMFVPTLARGQLPIAAPTLLRPNNAWKVLRGDGSDLPRDPRYTNHPAEQLRIETTETLFTLDGEILPCGSSDNAQQHGGWATLDVSLGPTLQVAVIGGEG